MLCSIVSNSYRDHADVRDRIQCSLAAWRLGGKVIKLYAGVRVHWGGVNLPKTK